MAACSRNCALGPRGCSLKVAAARLCTEAGARVVHKIILRDINLYRRVMDGRRVEVVSNESDVWGGVQVTDEDDRGRQAQACVCCAMRTASKRRCVAKASRSCAHACRSFTKAPSLSAFSGLPSASASSQGSTLAPPALRPQQDIASQGRAFIWRSQSCSCSARSFSACALSWRTSCSASAWQYKAARQVWTL